LLLLGCSINKEYVIGLIILVQGIAHKGKVHDKVT
jgi:hypothetical protein